jgi:sporulation protein YunB
MKHWHRYRPGRGAYRGERGGSYRKILLFFLGVVVMGVFLDVQLRPIVKSLTENTAKQTAVSAINQSVLQEISSENISYDDLIQIQRDENGKVLTITTNMAKMNEVKAKVTNAVQNNLNHGHMEVSVPLGTLFGSELLHGRGPGVPLVVTLAGNVTSDFKTNFESAGINQTRHQIYLEVHTGIYSFIPGVDTTTDVTTSVMVAETVIVGEVPQIFLGG